MRRLFCILAMIAALAILAACEPHIGDECESNIDCPAGALCDTTAPGGYCLTQGCQDNDGCAEEAVCVFFDDYSSFCLLACSSSDDCRGGYQCRDDLNDAGQDSFCYIAADADVFPFKRATDALSP